MAKNKNKEKAPRLSKKEIHEGLLTLFEMNPAKDLDIKHIFRHLQAKTHGAKMLVMDVIDDLVFDDYLARAAEGDKMPIKKPEFDEGRTQASVKFYSNTPRRVG